jgi:S1-C subfamily serine protease
MRCGFAIRVNDAGELVAWAKHPNVSHPRGIWGARVAGLMLLAAMLAGCAAPRVPLSTQAVPDLAAGVVQLISPWALGQGCPIAETLLLTARHLATQPQLLGPPAAIEAAWSDADGYSGSAVTIAYDAGRDLALMHADRAFRRWYPRAAAAPMVGETVLIVGYDYRHRLHRQIVRAEIVNLVATHLVLSSAGQPGFSGSCVLDAAGRVVGIFVAAIGLDAAPRHGLAVAVYGEWMPWQPL